MNYSGWRRKMKIGGFSVSQKYSDLYALLADDLSARDYFNQLPDYVCDQMEERASGINSLESMQHYADKLTNGDD